MKQLPIFFFFMVPSVFHISRYLQLTVTGHTARSRLKVIDLTALQLFHHLCADLLWQAPLANSAQIFCHGGLMFFFFLESSKKSWMCFQNLSDTWENCKKPLKQTQVIRFYIIDKVSTLFEFQPIAGFKKKIGETWVTWAMAPAAQLAIAGHRLL